jgi:hypothetical protein
MTSRIDIIGQNGNDGLVYHFNDVHGHTKGGRSPTHNSWSSMRDRCTNPNSAKYSRYGGRGIKVCDRWSNRVIGFINFLGDMGERPAGTTIDRIDVNGDYTPDNCRWATPVEQASNTTANVYVVCPDGVSRVLAEATRLSEVPDGTFTKRYYRGLRGEDLFGPTCHTGGGKLLEDVLAKIEQHGSLNYSKIARELNIDRRKVERIYKKHAVTNT